MKEFEIEKIDGYSVMSSSIGREHELSLSTKGLKITY